ncbi:MAG: protein-disulfide reductase DsbD [Pseudomonadota bacterium]
MLAKLIATRRLALWLTPGLLLFSGLGMAADPLPPDQVFRYSLHDTGSAIEVRWEIEPGYYLYKKKLGFSSLTDAVRLNPTELPDGLPHEDEYFGKQEIYRDGFVARLPYSGAGSAEIEIKSQGCADIGLCYPPQTWSGSVVLAGGGKTPLTLGGGSGPSLGGGLQDGEVLPPDQVFRPSLTVRDGRTLELAWQIEPGHYLYRDKVAVEPLTDGVQVESLALPGGESKFDEYFGDTEVYYDGVIAPVGLVFGEPAPAIAHFALSYQGCAEDTICYPPLKRYAAVDFATLTAAMLAPDAEAPAEGTVAAAEPRTAAQAAPAKESRQDMLARKISDGNLALVMGLFFVAGLGLALTPCVLPMIPILSGIIAGDGDNVTPARGFTLSLIYVLGMALTYTVAGALFAMAGQQAQAVFQQPWILGLFAALFVVLALSMFGLFELQMPSAIQSKLAAISGRQKGGTLIGTFVMGALSAVIVTACVAPPLVAALAVIGQTGDVLRGSLALFSLSIGMGAPLLLVGASAGQLLPKAGPWMVAVKGAFGFVMLGLAIYILERMLPGPVILALYAILVFMAGVFLGALTPLTPESGAGRKIGKGMGVLATFYGAVLLLGALSGGHDPLRPIDLAAVTGEAGAAHEGVEFRRIKTVAELDTLVADAAARGQPVMLDFYADWCVSCKEMEKYTFTDPAVQTALAPALLLQADVTANDADDRALLERFGLYGPPGIIFFTGDGDERQNYTVVGMMWPDEFAPHVEEAFRAPARTAAQ